MSINTYAASSSSSFNILQFIYSRLVPVAADVGAERKPMGFFKRLGQRIERKGMERKEAYLADSTDICDLEHRMKQFENMRSNNSSQWGNNSRYY